MHCSERQREGGRWWSCALWPGLTSMFRLRDKRIDAPKRQRERERGRRNGGAENQCTTVGKETDGLRESTRCCVGGLFNWWYHTSLSLFLSLLFSLFSASNTRMHTHTHTLTLMHAIFALSPSYPCMTRRPRFPLHSPACRELPRRFARPEPTKTNFNRSLPSEQQDNVVHILYEIIIKKWVGYRLDCKFM